MSIELAQLNLNRGHNEAAFDIFMELAKNDLNDDASERMVR